MDLKEMIAVMQAKLDGKKIQIARKGRSDWEDAPAPSWNWPLDGWVNVYEGSLSIPHGSKACADACASPSRLRCVHLREVEE